jgi:putative transposase
LFDGHSQFIVHWEIRKSMTEHDEETILQRALEQHPSKKSGIMSNNGPKSNARDFKEFIRVVGIMYVRTSPHYPLSNGKLEQMLRA